MTPGLCLSPSEKPNYSSIERLPLKVFSKVFNCNNCDPKLDCHFTSETQPLPALHSVLVLIENIFVMNSSIWLIN